MTTLRFIPMGNRKQKAYLSFRNIRLLARRINSSFLTSRRASVSSKRVARVLQAMSYRRLQDTATTQYSFKFDSITSSVNGVVPAAMNHCIAGIPISGNLSCDSEVIKVTLNNGDTIEVVDYVNSPLFVEDLLVIKTFAQAQNITLVQIDVFIKHIKPSVSGRTSEDCSDSVDISIPTEYRTSTISKSTLEPGEQIAKISGEVNPDMIAAKGEAENYEVTPSNVIEGNVLVVRFPKCSRGHAFANFTYHFPGTDSTINTLSKSLGVLFPIYIVVETAKQRLLPDWLDLGFNGRNAEVLEDQQDDDLLVESAITVFFRSFAEQVASNNAASTLVGTNDSRSGVRSPIPSEGSRPTSVPPTQRAEAHQSEGYTQTQALNLGTNQSNGTGGSPSANALKRPRKGPQEKALKDVKPKLYTKVTKRSFFNTTSGVIK